MEILSYDKSTLLESEEAINVLTASQKTSQEVKEKYEIAE